MCIYIHVCRYQVDRTHKLRKVACVSKGELCFRTSTALCLYLLLGKASRVKHEQISGVRVPKAVHGCIQKLVKYCNGSGTMYQYLPLHGIISGTWRGGTYCISNNLSFIYNYLSLMHWTLSLDVLETSSRAQLYSFPRLDRCLI